MELLLFEKLMAVAIVYLPLFIHSKKWIDDNDNDELYLYIYIRCECLCNPITILRIIHNGDQCKIAVNSIFFFTRQLSPRY